MDNSTSKMQASPQQPVGMPAQPMPVAPQPMMYQPQPGQMLTPGMMQPAAMQGQVMPMQAQAMPGQAMPGQPMPGMMPGQDVSMQHSMAAPGAGPPAMMPGYGQMPMGAAPAPPAQAQAPQSFAIPGQDPTNAEAPPPFQLPPPLPVAHNYPWQPGCHYSVGQPVQFQQIYYPPPAAAEKSAQQEVVAVAPPQQFEQGKIDMKLGLGIKVANKGSHCLDCWQLELILFLIVAATIPIAILFVPAVIAVPIIIYLIRFKVLCSTDTSKFLSKLNLDLNPYEHTATLQQTQPYTTWRIRCYHMERRVSSNHIRQRRVRYVRVYTHENHKLIKYRDAQDASPILSGLEQYRMTRFYNSLRIAFATEEANQYYLDKRRNWIRDNDRDVHYEFYENHGLPRLISHMLTFNDDKAKYPKCLTCCCLIILAFLMIDWILIFWFMRHSARIDYEYLKVANKID